jgi:hypothetical protein
MPTHNLSNDYTINNFSESINKGDVKVSKTTSGEVSVTVAFDGKFGSGMVNDILRISDGSTTVDFVGVHTGGGGNASGAAEIGVGGDRSADETVDEFVSKINSSALDLTAVDLGGDDDAASMKLTPGTGKTITVTEDPSGNDQFGPSDGFTIVTTSGGSITTDFKFAPFRLSVPCAQNIRQQSSNSGYKTFIGEQKT